MVRITSINVDEPSESYTKVLHYFFSFPEKPTSLNDLARNIKSSKTAVKEAVIKSVHEGFLAREVVGNAWRISANSKSSLLITRKIPYNLELIYQTGIVTKVYNKIPEARAIILFGSYRWGTDNEKSDIDIAVEVLGDQPMRIGPLLVFDRLGFRKKVTVNLHLFSRSRIDLNVFTNIANGIVLDGLLEVHP